MGRARHRRQPGAPDGASSVRRRAWRRRRPSAAAVEQLLALDPGFNLSDHLRRTQVAGHYSLRHATIDGLRRAGIPEQPGPTPRPQLRVVQGGLIGLPQPSPAFALRSGLSCELLNYTIKIGSDGKVEIVGKTEGKKSYQRTVVGASTRCATVGIGAVGTSWRA